MSPITKIKVGRGVTRRPGEAEEWERRYFEIEAEVEPDEIPDQVKDYLEMKLSEWLEEVPAPVSRAEVEAIPEIQGRFPEDLQELLEFTETEEFIVVKPRQFLGSDNFAKIATIIRDAGGEYISAGRESCFRVPKPTPAKAEVGKSVVAEFDPQELMGHPWKGRKTSEGQYAKGSVSWGWDWRGEFSPSVIKTLEKGPLQIDQYEFTLSERIVQAKKIKRSNPHAKMDETLRSIKIAGKRLTGE